VYSGVRVEVLAQYCFCQPKTNVNLGDAWVSLDFDCGMVNITGFVYAWPLVFGAIHRASWREVILFTRSRGN